MTKKPYIFLFTMFLIIGAASCSSEGPSASSSGDKPPKSDVLNQWEEGYKDEEAGLGLKNQEIARCFNDETYDGLSAKYLNNFVDTGQSIPKDMSSTDKRVILDAVKVCNTKYKY